MKTVNKKTSLTGIRFDARAVHLFWTTGEETGESVLYRRSDGTLRFDPDTRIRSQQFQTWLLSTYAAWCAAFLNESDSSVEETSSAGEWARIEWQLKKEAMYRRKLKQLEKEKQKESCCASHRETRILAWRAA